MCVNFYNFIIFNHNIMKLLLFDVDGTLTVPRKKIHTEMVEILKEIKQNKNIHLGFVGGSNLEKQLEQLGEENFDLFYWRFSENGLLCYKDNQCIHEESFVKKLGEIHFQKLINITLNILSNIECPVKRGTFIEYRNGMINISPIGRACSQDERENFEKYDKIHHIREEMIKKIQHHWANYIYENDLQQLPKIKYSIGGQISVDVFPEGWDKTYCLQFVQEHYDEIHFFGDKTEKGGNDFEIYNDARVIGHNVTKYQDTIKLLQNYL